MRVTFYNLSDERAVPLRICDEIAVPRKGEFVFLAAQYFLTVHTFHTPEKNEIAVYLKPLRREELPEHV